MKKYSVFLGVLAVLALLLACRVLAQQPAQPEQSKSASQSSQSHPPDIVTTLPGVLLSTETLLGSNVKSLQGQNVGDLKQLMLDPHTGRVMYAVVSMGGFLGMGEKTIVVPWHAIEIARNGQSLALHLSPQMLQQAPAYEGVKESMQAPASEPRGDGWGGDTVYGRLYDPAKEETISGYVVSIDTSTPLPGMALGIQMLVQTDDGKNMRVQIGPAWYLDRQNLNMQGNTRVQVTGARVEIEGQPVLMAREIQCEGQLITLRDAQGMPMWSSLRRGVAK
jgi:sporulation protein YlmC with PRC-barrel domain